MARRVGLLKSVGIGSVAVATALGAGYLWAFVEGRRAAAQLEEQLAKKDQEQAEQVEIHALEVFDLRSAHEQTKAELTVVVVQRKLDRALRALEAGKFGVHHQDELREAGKALAGLPCHEEFLSAPTDLQNIEVPVTGDLAAIEERVRGHALRIATLRTIPDDWMYSCVPPHPRSSALAQQQ